VRFLGAQEVMMGTMIQVVGNSPEQSWSESGKSLFKALA